MQTNNTAMPANGNDNSEKLSKLKRAIVIGVLITLAVIGWHLYEHFAHQSAATDRETLGIEHDIIVLSQKLYAIESEQHNDYLTKVNFQGKTSSHARDDHAKEPLLQVRNDLIAADTSSTAHLMKRLFDNYELETHIVEKQTAEKHQEETDFLDAILKTPVMKQTMQFLQQKELVAGNYNAQLQLLKDIWFTPYSRGQGRVGSSGFEHVFLAEIKNQNILGLHNWLYFNEQEQNGLLDYKGFIQRVNLGHDNRYLLALRFTFHDMQKPYNTLLIGTSPELEMSLYTVCFLVGIAEACAVRLGSTNFNIITHTWDWHGKKTLATAYPSIENSIDM